MKIGEYIKTYRIKHEMSMQELADRCSLSKAYISMMEKGVNPTTGKPFIPAIETLVKLAEGTNTNINTLLQMIDGMESVILNSREVPPGCPNILPIEKKKIPVLGRIACGKPILSEEVFEGYVYSGAAVRADFCLRAAGNSMINARIYDGDIVFIKQQPYVENGEIAAVSIDNEVTLKRVYVWDDYVELRSENPKYRSMIYRRNDFDKFRIIGKAIAFQGDVI